MVLFFCFNQRRNQQIKLILLSIAIACTPLQTDTSVSVCLPGRHDLMLDIFNSAPGAHDLMLGIFKFATAETSNAPCRLDQAAMTTVPKSFVIFRCASCGGSNCMSNMPRVPANTPLDGEPPAVETGSAAALEAPALLAVVDVSAPPEAAHVPTAAVEATASAAEVGSAAVEEEPATPAVVEQPAPVEPATVEEASGPPAVAQRPVPRTPPKADAPKAPQQKAAPRQLWESRAKAGSGPLAMLPPTSKGASFAGPKEPAAPKQVQLQRPQPETPQELVPAPRTPEELTRLQRFRQGVVYKHVV